MRRCKKLGVALVAIFALAAATAATSAMAFELPDIHPLPEGGTVNVKGAGGISKLETEIGEALEAEKVETELEVKSLASLGAATIKYINVQRKKDSCNTEGAAKGEVVVPGGVWHLVDLGSTPETLKPALLILFTTLSMKCEKLTIKIGPEGGRILGGLPTITTNDQTVAAKGKFTAEFACAGKGKQAITSWINDAGTTLTKELLLANFGLGNEFVCEQAKVELETPEMLTFLF